MRKYDTLLEEEKTVADQMLLSEPFSEEMEEYRRLCWLEVTQEQLDNINSTMPEGFYFQAGELGGQLLINLDVLSEALGEKLLSPLYPMLSSSTWRYVEPYEWENVSAEDEFEIEEWQPYDGTPATIYQVGKTLWHNDLKWISTVANNVWEPSVFGWKELTVGDIPPTWRQPLGAGDTYASGDIVMYHGKKWTSNIDNNVWNPEQSQWTEVTGEEPDIGPEAWVQPTGAHDAYALDAVVTHNGLTWKSLYAANVWEPSVFGWVQI